MNGYEYEQYCAEWLKKHGFHHVHVTKASNDQGIDILASKKQKRYGFQCKYYVRFTIPTCVEIDCFYLRSQ